MKTHFPFSAIKTSSVIQRAIAVLLFTALISFSKNSSACNASFIDSTSGTIVQFINTSQASNTAYWFWSFGDGTSSDLENPIHQYNGYGPYMVCLTVYDTASNCSDSICAIVNGGPGCAASFYYAAQVNFVNFVNTSTAGNAPTWYWDFGDGTTSTQESPSHQYAGSGTYYACLTLTDTSNNCSDEDCQYVVVGANGGCSAGFYYTNYGSTVSFFNLSQASNSAYWHWTFGDSTSSDLENPVHQYNGYGPYYVCLTVYDTANNCTSDTCGEIFLNNGGGCQAYYTYSGNGLTVDFTNLSAGNYTSVVWSFGDNTISYFNNPSHTYIDSGSYYVCVTVSDTGINCNDTYCQWVFVNGSGQLCNASFSYAANGTNVQFINNSSSCNSAIWFWEFGDGTSSTNFDPSHQYASAGYYNVCMSMYDSYCACADTVCETVYAGGNNLPCAAVFVLYPDSFQQGLYWGYNYSTGNNLVYYWSWGDGGYSTGPYPSHVYADSGYYTICLSILDTVSFCSDSVCTNYYILKQAKLDQIHEVIFVNATGVPGISTTHDIQWSIFPNPASTNIRIETNADKIDAIRITDVSGKVMKQISSYKGDFISLSLLPQGVYIVQTMIDGGWSSKLLIRQ